MPEVKKITCFNLKMNPFISYLTGEEPVPDNWDDIYSEYIGLRENKSTSIVLDLIKEIIRFNSKIFIIETCVKVLANKYYRDLAIELKQCGCRGKFDWSNPIEYSTDLKAAISKAQTYFIQVS